MTKSEVFYNDVTAKSLGEFEKALPPHDVAVYLGSLPGKNGWFRVSVVRSSDLMGKTMFLYLGDQVAVSLGVRSIIEGIMGAMDAPLKTTEKKQ